jgi:hypothetical protein
MNNVRDDKEEFFIVVSGSYYSVYVGEITL